MKVIPSFENVETIGNINYGDPTLCAYYMTRFALSYAFEYTVIYDIVLRDYCGTASAADYAFKKEDGRYTKFL